MPIAGPVFTEWYWGPIFFALLFGPPLVAAAFAVDFVVRRRRGPLSLGRRAALWVAVIFGGALAIVSGRELIADIRFDREASAAAHNLDFTPYAANPLPQPFREELVKAQDFGQPVVISRYGAGPGAYAFAYQQRPAADTSLQDGRCSLHRLAGTGTNFFEGPCRELRTPRGLPVFLGTSQTVVDGGEAFALLDGTLVRLAHTQVADRDVLAYFDALEPVAPADLEFKRG